MSFYCTEKRVSLGWYSFIIMFQPTSFCFGVSVFNNCASISCWPFALIIAVKAEE